MVFLILLDLQFHKLLFVPLGLVVLLLTILADFAEAFPEVVVKLADFFEIVGDFSDGLLN